MAYKMKGFGGFKSPTKFKMGNGKMGNRLRGGETFKDRLIMEDARLMASGKKPLSPKQKKTLLDMKKASDNKIRKKKITKFKNAQETLRKINTKKPFSKGLDMTLNENLNKAVRKSEAKEFLRKNTIKPKPQKPLSRPFGPGTRPLAKNVSRGLKTFGRRLGVIGAVMGVKDVFDAYGRMGKTKEGREIIKRGRMQPGKI